MSILSVNLKHLYQRRGFWLVYLILGLLVHGAIVSPLLRPPRTGAGEYVVPVMLAFLVGFIVTMSQVEILSRPFSYCLPGHRRILRKYVFCMAVPVSLLCCLVFLVYPGLGTAELLLVLCSAFFANLTFYMAGAVLAEGARNAVLLLGFMPVFGMIFTVLLNLHILLERVIIGNVFAVIVVGIIGSIAAWFWLGREGLARRHCSTLRIGLMDIFNKDKMKRYEYKRMEGKGGRLRGHPRPWVDEWFLRQMNRHDYKGPGRYYWGAQYSASALALSGWRNCLLLVFILVVMFGYIGGSAAIALITMPAILGIARQAPVFSTMLICGGRGRRFTTALRMVATDAVMICVATLVISGLSVLFYRFMPTFTIEGKEFAFSTIDPRVAIVPLVFLPVACAIQLACHDRPLLLWGGLLLMVYVGVFVMFGWRERFLNLVNPLSVVISIIVSWALFVIVLRHVCLKWCLVGARGGH